MNGININLTITSPDLHDAFLALAEAINNMGTPFKVPAMQETPAKGVALGKVSEDPTTMHQQATADQYAQVAAPVKAQKAVEPEPIVEEAAITLEAVRALAMKKSKEDKAAVKAAIVSVGGTRVTDVDPAKYPEFVALLEAI